jgi:CRP-like cAMP-binding protein
MMNLLARSGPSNQAGAPSGNSYLVDVLRRLPLFSGCRGSELTKIERLVTELLVGQGDVLALQGEPGLEFFVVVSGVAKAYRGVTPIGDLGPGSFFGEVALLDGGTRTATIVAETDMRVLVISRSEFRTLQSVAPQVTRKIAAEIGARMRRTLEMLDSRP